MDKLSSQLIIQILNKKMNMPKGSVWLRDQNAVIPNDQGLYISVGIVNQVCISNETYMREGNPSNTWDMLGGQFDLPNEYYDTPQPLDFDVSGTTWDGIGQTYVDPVPSQYDQPGQTFDVAGQTFDAPLPTTPMTEVNKVQMQEFIQIDLFSRSNKALYRNWEIMAALQSIYAQQVMELHQFKIFRIPRSMINTSYAEGGSQLNRYTLTVCCFVWYVKETLLMNDDGDYYDDFTLRLDDKNTIGSQAPYQYDQQNQNFDVQGQTFDQKPPLVQFEINQIGITPYVPFLIKRDEDQWLTI